MIIPPHNETAVLLAMIAITAVFFVHGQRIARPAREMAITTAMVFVMVAVASVFFLLADQVMRLAVTLLLGIST